MPKSSSTGAYAWSCGGRSTARRISDRLAASPAVNKTITLALTGASGMPYGIRLLECLLASGTNV